MNLRWRDGNSLFLLADDDAEYLANKAYIKFEDGEYTVFVWVPASRTTSWARVPERFDNLDEAKAVAAATFRMGVTP